MGYFILNYNFFLINLLIYFENYRFALIFKSLYQIKLFFFLINIYFSLFFCAGKRDIIGGSSISNCSIGGLSRAINNTGGYSVAPGGANMTPEDTAPDEEFALAITQKTQVRNFFIYSYICYA